MVGLLIFGVIGLWIWFSIVMGRKLPKWFKIEKHPHLARWGFTVLLIALPWADEIAGRADFAYYCNKYADVIVAEGEGDPSGDYKIEGLDIQIKTPFLPKIYVKSKKVIDLITSKEIRVHIYVRQDHGWFLRHISQYPIRGECSENYKKKHLIIYDDWTDKIRTDSVAYKSIWISRFEVDEELNKFSELIRSKK